MSAQLSQNLLLTVPLAPLAGSLIAGLAGKAVGRRGAHTVTILGVFIAFIVSLMVLKSVAVDGARFNATVYEWMTVGGLRFEIGFLVDGLTAMMMAVVTFVSLMVHVYTIGYMAEDPGYQRFFSYISLFTFSMLILVMSNNFLQLFFGWEAVGLVSYLLIGFWYTRPTAIYANLKAFLVNRVGNFGFLLGIGLILANYGSLDYGVVFSKVNSTDITLICILLFVGAMGKSAQFPLHVWLPDSMEGPTPISALIHAATMVTAGIFMVARMSPLFELSETALSFVMVIGAITALFMALIAVVQYDIKRVVAYSTLSQLGYMTVALGASAYSAAIFHLMTHAFFKALLFLGAGSAIIALHHEQDMRRMGGLWKLMPWTYGTVLIGAIASAGVPGFAGFFSKDAIIEAVHLSRTPGAGFAWFAVTACVFVTAFYTFRLVFYAFHGKERFETHDHAPHESPAVVTVPLVLLAIPSICVGWLIGRVLFGDYFGASISIAPSHPGLRELAGEFHGVLPMMAHAVKTIPFWLTVAGIAEAWYLYILRPELPAKLRQRAGVLVTVLEEKYGFDRFYDWFFAGGARKFGSGLWRFGDVTVIAGLMVDGSGRLIGWFAGVVRRVQSEFIYHYAFFMIIGVSMLLTYFIFFSGTLVR